MGVHNNKRVATLFLAAYLVSGMLLEIAHHDSSALMGATRPAMMQYRAADRAHDCAACALSAVRLSTEALSHEICLVHAAIIARIDSDLPGTFSPEHLLPGKRGPPLA